MNRFCSTFRMKKLNILGMVHLLALPGSPRHVISIDEICENACKEAQELEKAGLDGIIVENMHDIPYLKSEDHGPEVVACMTKVCTEVRRAVSKHLPCGLQILAAANKEAIAVAYATGFNFVRVEGFVFGHVADEGWIEACAGPLLRYRTNIGADNVLILCDIKKKHSSHAITADVSLVETAEAAKFFLSDGVIVTGTATGKAANPQDVQEIQHNCHDLPVLVGSGVSSENVHLFRSADAVIVGSYFKKDGRWQNKLDVTRINQFTEIVSNLRDGCQTAT